MLVRMKLRLCLLGSPHVLRDGAAATALAPRDAVMLAWLVIVGPTTRAQMAAMLWSDRGDEQARNSLRQRLFQLRRQLGVDLVVGATSMNLAAGLTHDLEDGSGLLADLTLPECPSLHAWLQVTRDRRARRERGLLIESLDALEAKADWDAALPLAESLVDLEPLSEHAHRRVMRLHYLRGDRASALLAFDQLERRLKDDVGTRPDAASLTLLRTIEQSEPLGDDNTASRPMPASLVRPPQLIGREAVLSRITKILDEGRIVALVGDAGMGKSRLLQALVQSPRESMHWIGRPGDSITPYATLSRGLRALLQGLPPELPASFPVEVQADLARVLPELAVAHHGPASAGTGAGAGGGMPVHAVKHLLRTVWPKGTTFILDDLHFADDASVELLQKTIDDEDRQLSRVVFAMRPAPRSQNTKHWVQELIEAGVVVPIILEPLKTEDLAQLINTLHLPGIEGHELAATLHHRTGGNPLFALETLKLAWSETSTIDAAHLPRPGNVSQLIEQQLSMLSPAALMLARAAALAGTDFSLELAEAVLEQHAVVMADAWRELEMHQVMRDEAFAHDLVYETVREGVPDAIGRNLHARIAAWLEAHGGEPARIASHHEASGRGDLALPGLRAAAERAHAALREPERIEFLLRAADLAEAQGERALAFDCVRDAIEAHIGFSRDDKLLPQLDRLDALAATPLQRAVAAHICVYYRINLGQWLLAAQDGERVIALADASGDDEVKVVARQRLGTAYAMTGQCEAALEQLLSIRDWMDRHAVPDVLNEFRGNLAVAMDNAGHIDDARRMHQEALVAMARREDHAQRATNLGNFAVNRLNAGDVSAAREPLAVAQHLVETYAMAGSRRAFIVLLQARCARALGHINEALTLFERARSDPRVVLDSLIRLHESQCWLDLGALDRAAKALNDVLERDVPARYRARALVFRARLARSQQQRGEAFIDEAFKIAPTGGWHDLRLLVRTEACVHQAPDAALKELADIVRESRRMGYLGTALAAQLRACEIAATARPEAAARLARQAVMLGANVEAETLPRIDRWLQPARALEAAGEVEEAGELARLGAEWLRETATHHVAERWREGFLERNPAHKLMLTMADRLG